ncbi:MAG: hypothetical protein V2A55_01735 [Candidatus Jorgensenbacteria bacterium]
MNGVNPTPKFKPLFVSGVIVVIVAALVAWYLIERSVETAEEKAVGGFEDALESAGDLPEINPLSNPLEELPDVNPVDAANPFKGIKTNPF